MTEAEYATMLEELDRQLNDPDIPMDPARVWALLADLRTMSSPSVRADPERSQADLAGPGLGFDNRSVSQLGDGAPARP